MTSQHPPSSPQILIATLMRSQGDTGVQTHFNAFCHFLQDQGVAFSLVTPFDWVKWIVLPVFALRRVIDPFNSELSVAWYRYWHYRFLKAALHRRVRALVQSGVPVLIYAQDPLAAKAALEVRPSIAEKVVMTVHFNGSQADEWAGKGKIRKEGRVYRRIQQLEREVLPLVDGLTFTTQMMRQHVESAIPGVRSVPTQVIPCFIVSPFQESAPSPSPPVEGDLITIGTLEPRKNQRYLLQLLAAANQRGKRYSLTLVGNGPDLATLRSLTQELGLEAQVQFLGAQPRAAQWLPRHQLYVHSAVMEGFGIALLEAMACGLPVLAGAVGGIPEVFADGREGSYLDLDDVDRGATQLIQMMDDPQQRHQMGHVGQERFRNCYEVTVVGQRLLSFLQQIITD